MRLSTNEAELKNVNTRKAANKISTMPTIKKGSAMLENLLFGTTYGGFELNAEARTFEP